MFDSHCSRNRVSLWHPRASAAGKLVGAGAYAYSPGDVTMGSEEVVRYQRVSFEMTKEAYEMQRLI